MTDAILIVAISLITAIVVGSGVFLAWTFMEKLASRPRATEAESPASDAEPEKTDRN